MPRPRAFNEDEVIASANQAFSRTGYAGTSIDDLVAATGLGRQSLYNAFGGKKELFMRVLLSDTADAVAALEALHHGDSPLVRIRTQLLKVAVTYGSAREQPSLFAKAAMELSSSDPDVAASVLKTFDDMQGHYQACIRDGQEAGEIQADADAEALGAYFVALIEGMAILGGSGVARTKLTTVGLTALAAIPLTEHGRAALEVPAGEWT
ncbi:TetR/AcrR family transcriptional regulator [Curtobacterium sp. ISL-83]|uniref:TetR/AcrR family transcriptional regulator n=1 Tax=Curtobacterium sp. ISL-83 TaxID=2819145 RepID=UPI001BE8BC4B|nr:TetR/AcrR family transcriptional regulator [Curtobacterium sp. ISL-83]MBT2501303.1 TetR/AcrR family transcriptional regulator [Curtobacterium sp. ISL-83]